MIYRVKHITSYRYSVPVSTSHHELHVLLRGSRRQTVEIRDAVGRPRARGSSRSLRLVRQPRHPPGHPRAPQRADRHLRGGAAGAPAAPPASPGRPWEATRDWVRAAADPEARAAFEWVLPSPHVEVSDAARELALPSFSPGRPLAEAARDLMTRIHGLLKYDPEATDVSTSVEEVLRGGRGVCQDFAHVQIACLRAMGLPARYVSGYLVTTRPPASRASSAPTRHMPGSRFARPSSAGSTWTRPTTCCRPIGTWSSRTGATSAT